MTGTGNTSSDAAGRALNGRAGTQAVYYNAQQGALAAQQNLEKEATSYKSNIAFLINNASISDAVNKSNLYPVVDTNGVFTGQFVMNNKATRAALGVAPINQPVGLKIKGSSITGAYAGYFQVAAAATAAGAPPKGGGGNGGKGGTTDTKQTPPPETVDPNGWSWNLPPHKWSLPLSLRTGNVISGMETSTKTHSEMYRRGRIWWKWNDPNISLTQNAGNGAKDTYAKTTNNDNSMYGFQFLWNPTDFNTAVSVQMDSTPSVGDRFLGGAGFFPGTESITITIHLDRTNDFAAAAAVLNNPGNDQTKYGKTVIPFITRDQVLPFVSSYTQGTGFTSANKIGNIDIQDKLVDLFQRGTIADLEFLYRTINGIGPAGATNQAWVNGRGQKTADIGFLQPTLVNIDIGPLSYAGYVNNLSVTHKMFTVDMIPMSTDVTMSLQLLATAGIQNNNTGTATTQTPGPTSTAVTNNATSPTQ